MVRRWSHINNFNFSLKNKKLRFFKKSSKSRVFKLTVSTRKFFKKYTKFRRKAFNRLRHKTNWLIYSNVLKFWSHDYLNTKTFNKKIWITNSQQFNIIIFNWSSVKNLNPELYFNFNYNILNVNSFFLKKSTFYNSFFFFWKNFKNSSIALTEDFSINDADALSSLCYYDNFFYELTTDAKLTYDYNFFLFFETNEEITHVQFLNFYKLFTYLTFLDFI